MMHSHSHHRCPGLDVILSGAEERALAPQDHPTKPLPQDSQEQSLFLCIPIGTWCRCGRGDVVERRPEQERGGV